MHSTRKPLDSGPPQLISCRSPERSPGVSFRPISPLKQPVSPVSILAPLPSTPTINVAKSLEGGIPRTYSEIDLDGEPMNLADFRAKYNQPGFYIMKDADPEKEGYNKDAKLYLCYTEKVGYMFSNTAIGKHHIEIDALRIQDDDTVTLVEFKRLDQLIANNKATFPVRWVRQQLESGNMALFRDSVNPDLLKDIDFLLKNEDVFKRFEEEKENLLTNVKAHKKEKKLVSKNILKKFDSVVEKYCKKILQELLRGNKEEWQEHIQADYLDQFKQECRSAIEHIRTVCDKKPQVFLSETPLLKPQVFSYDIPVQGYVCDSSEIRFITDHQESQYRDLLHEIIAEIFQGSSFTCVIEPRGPGVRDYEPSVNAVRSIDEMSLIQIVENPNIVDLPEDIHISEKILWDYKTAFEALESALFEQSNPQG